MKTGIDRAETADSPRVARTAHRPGVRLEGSVEVKEAIWGVAEVSAYLQIPASSIYKMTARRAAVRIPHIHIGGTLRFRRADIDRWLTLLTVSNLDALTKMRQKAVRGSNGNDPQTHAP